MQISYFTAFLLIIFSVFIWAQLIFDTENWLQFVQLIRFGVSADSSLQNINFQNGQFLSIMPTGSNADKNYSRYPIYQNENTIRLDSEPVNSQFDLPPNWQDLNKSCSSTFKCISDFSTGWNDNKSIQISTMNSTNGTYSQIVSKEVPVVPNERYNFVTHMRHNEWAVQSQVNLQLFNETSKIWYEVEKCPPSINNSLVWNEYGCVFTVEPNVTKARAILNAGWTSQVGHQAVTWFDSLYMIGLKPFLTDPNLKAEVVYQGLVGPISMQFLGPDDFLVIENKGTVQRITDGKHVSQPLSLSNVAEYQGLLGIAIQKEVDGNRTQDGTYNNHTYVFLYYTANKNDTDLNGGKEGTRNQLYRYDLLGNKLVNPKKLLELPAEYDHNGGPLLIGPDNKTVYVSIGDLENQAYQVIAHKALNNKSGTEPNGSGGILRVNFEGKPIQGGLLGNTYPLNLYYAYGIRESFGMDFDPVTGRLWNTENGANWGDEINLVNPGFNGGWNKVQGIWKNVGDGYPNGTGFPKDSDITYNPADLVDFDGKGKYRSPEFSWYNTVGPTALKFLSTDKLGKKYENDMLVADVNNGRIYHFKLNENRSSLRLNGSLADKVANTDKELQNVIFAKGFGLITDLKLGYDGYLYVVVYNEGKIYRISPRL